MPKVDAWVAEFVANGGYDCMFNAWLIKDVNGDTVASFDCTGVVPEEMARANLLAAAPDLLEACKKARYVLVRETEMAKALGWPKNDFTEEALQLAEASIAKAEGRV